MKKIVLLLLLATSSSLLAQKDNFWLYGKLKDSSSVVKNANIINLKTNKAQFQQNKLKHNFRSFPL